VPGLELTYVIVLLLNTLNEIFLIITLLHLHKTMIFVTIPFNHFMCMDDLNEWSHHMVMVRLRKNKTYILNYNSYLFDF